MVAVVVVIEAAHHIQLNGAVEIERGEYATRKRAAHRNEVDFGIETLLQLGERLPDFGQVLVAERLVDRHIVVAPRVVGCGLGLDASTCAARDGIDMHIGVEQQVFGQRQQCQLNGCGKAAWVGHVLAVVHYAAAVELGQAIHKIVGAVGQTEVLREVDYAHVAGHLGLVLLNERARKSVRSAEKQHIGALKRQPVGKPQVGVAN